MNKKVWFMIGTGVFLFAAGVGVVVTRRPVPSGTGEAALASSSSSEGTASIPQPRVLLAQAQRLETEGSLLEAKRLYRELLQNPQAAESATAAQERLGLVNLKLLRSPALTPDAISYVVQPGDTLSKIAKQHRTTVQLLQAANHLTSDRIRPGQRLKVSTAPFSLIVDKSQNTLTLKQAEEVLKVYRCSTGQGGITPTGTFKVANRIIDPPWFTPDGVIPPGDPRNILGSRWLGFDLPSYGVHGTTDPASIGKPVTQGCVRLSNADVEELFDLLPEGTPVTIVE